MVLKLISQVESVTIYLLQGARSIVEVVEQLRVGRIWTSSELILALVAPAE